MWNEDEYRFKDVLKFNEFISWLYPRPSVEAGSVEAKGDFEKRRLARRDDLRTVSFLLTSAEKQFEQFRNGTANLETAFATATAEALEKKSAESVDRVKEVFDSLSAPIKVLDNVPHKMLRQEDLNKQLKESLDRLNILVQDLYASF